MQSNLRSIVVGSAGLLICCLASVPLVMGEDPAATSSPDQILARLAVSEVEEFESWQRVSDRLGWGPWQCSAPSQRQLFSVYLSKSQDEATHGRKLYHLYAKFGKDYLALNGTIGRATPDDSIVGPKPENARQHRVGQIIVKRTWRPEEVDAELVEWDSPEGSIGRAPTAEFVKKDDQWYRTGDAGPLFVMMKVGDAQVEHTDHGWVYATLTPDGKEVTSAGLIESCMNCHAKAPHDRLFGLRNY